MARNTQAKGPSPLATRARQLETLLAERDIPIRHVQAMEVVARLDGARNRHGAATATADMTTDDVRAAIHTERNRIATALETSGATDAASLVRSDFKAGIASRGRAGRGDNANLPTGTMPGRVGVMPQAVPATLSLDGDPTETSFDAAGFLQVATVSQILAMLDDDEGNGRTTGTILASHFANLRTEDAQTATLGRYARERPGTFLGWIHDAAAIDWLRTNEADRLHRALALSSMDDGDVERAAGTEAAEAVARIRVATAETDEDMEPNLGADGQPVTTPGLPRGHSVTRDDDGDWLLIAPADVTIHDEPGEALILGATTMEAAVGEATRFLSGMELKSMAIARYAGYEIARIDGRYAYQRPTGDGEVTAGPQRRRTACEAWDDAERDVVERLAKAGRTTYRAWTAMTRDERRRTAAWLA